MAGKRSTEDAAYASLGPTLLARKGGARPAMRPQHGPINPAASANLEDLGWNDMGDSPEQRHPQGEVLPLTPMESPSTGEKAEHAKPVVRKQIESLAERLGGVPEDEAPEDKAGKTMAHKPKRPVRKAAFTLRLDQQRHLRLRLACTIRNCSAQQLVTEAVDRMLGDISELDSLAAQVKPR